MTIRPRRSRRSCSEVARVSSTMTSLAAVMSKPVSRASPSCRAPSPMTTLRRARSLTSRTRRQVMLRTSMPSVVAVVQVVVDHRREQVVGGRDGVEVAGEVQVEPLHRDDLAVAATGRTALDPERRPHRRLTQRDDRPLAEAVQRLREPDRGRGLALAERRRRHRRDDDVLGRMRRRGLVEDREVDLGDAAAVRLEVLVTDAEVGGDVGEADAGSLRSRSRGRWAGVRS